MKKDTMREIEDYKQKLVNAENVASELQRKVY